MHTLNPDLWNLQHREPLLRYALRRISDYGTAEDLVQDTFVSAWQGRRHFRGDCSERTWLTGILRNKVIDSYRRNSRRRTVMSTDLDRKGLDGDDMVSWMDRQPDPSPRNRPELETEKNEFLADLEAAVEQLPGKMGEAFRLRELDGRSTEEITEELQISKANLWVLIHRAKQSLGQTLGREWADTDGFQDRMAA